MSSLDWGSTMLSRNLTKLIHEYNYAPTSKSSIGNPIDNINTYSNTKCQFASDNDLSSTSVAPGGYLSLENPDAPNIILVSESTIMLVLELK